MDESTAPKRRLPTLRETLAATRTNTLIAAGILGVMWGPVLASILDAATRVAEADLPEPLPVQRTVPPEMSAQATDVAHTRALLRKNDATLNELRALTGFNGPTPQRPAPVGP